MSKKGPPPPFGACPPGAFRNAVRVLAHLLPDVALFRKTSSILLGPAGGRDGRAYDVSVFGSMKARLHPYDNICEKRVYLTPQHWDPDERRALAKFIERGAGPFVFVDVGANAGLYSLFAASAARRAGRAIAIVAIEADPVMCVRMAFNFAASGVKAKILPYAATAAHGAVRLQVNARSRGMTRIVEDGGEAVEGAPIASMLAEQGVEHVDAMKIDIEGHEYAALDAFFANAPEALWPRFVIIETSHEDPERAASALIASRGYKTVMKNRLNAVFERG
ncbi:MAG: FkbM family methyltransferase [Alphaproteobacteria bacterium]|nr:FkbM family methyltransferase [Alphaproteobacteria bacterium]